MDVLAQRLNIATSKNKSRIGIKVCPLAEKIPCVLFADDSLLFCKAKLDTYCKLSSLLSEFCNQSRKLINFQKLVLVFSKNATSVAKAIVAGVFTIPHRDSLGKYLGCPIFQGRTSSNTFFELVNKIDRKSQNWNPSSLSKAGRVILIQSNLKSLPSHTMQCFKLHKSISNKLDRINRDFLWKKSRTKKGLPMVSWDKICGSKKIGGLGLRKTEAVNNAFLCKPS